uniref:Eukaryotic translation initiation factor 3 subunit G N-terminal domain-containing protein n=1 Tax=Oryctolagus cuniculus TaxID=9986 RepID=A0A5F9C4G8_RABIT
MPTRALDLKPSRTYQVEEESKDDKCVISKLLKGIPLATRDTGPEPELGPGTSLPRPKEVIKGNIKTVTKCKLNEDDKKFRMVHTFRIKTQKASKAIARRKNWKKFENSEFDTPGPNGATTMVSDDVSMTFIASKDHLNFQEEEDPMNKLKDQKTVCCCICKWDHWITRHPSRDTLRSIRRSWPSSWTCPLVRKRRYPESWSLCRPLRTRLGSTCHHA